jgi:hypothetical protein
MTTGEPIKFYPVEYVIRSGTSMTSNLAKGVGSDLTAT